MSYKMACSGACGRPEVRPLLGVTVPSEVSGGETEASISSCGMHQHCRGGGYRGDARPEGRSQCEPDPEGRAVS